MATPARVEQTRQIRRLTTRSVNGLWRLLPGDLADLSDVLLGEMPTIVDELGNVAATVAADHFEAVTNLPAVFADPPPSAAVQANTRWALSPMRTPEPDPAATLARLEQIADRMVLQQADDTTFQSVEIHELRYAWVTHGDTCEYCVFQASRGAVFVTRERARKHADCDCTIEPVMTPADLDRLAAEYPEYDREAAYAEYRAAREAAGTTAMKPVLAAMRAARSAT